MSKEKEKSFHLFLEKQGLLKRDANGDLVCDDCDYMDFAKQYNLCDYCNGFYPSEAPKELIEKVKKLKLDKIKNEEKEILDLFDALPNNSKSNVLDYVNHWWHNRVCLKCDHQNSFGEPSISDNCKSCKKV